jgi:hypothetical protein
MLNFIQGTTGPAIIYGNSISNADITYGNYFLFVFQSTYSKRKVYVQPSVDVRNERFIQFTVGATGLQEMQNWTYQCWNLSQEPGCAYWETDEDIWDLSTTIWNVCGGTASTEGGILIDKGQMFLTPA